MRARGDQIPGVLAVVAGFLLVLAVPATGPAQGPGVSTLQEKRAALAARSRAALVELYALESRLAQARADLARLDAQAARLAREQASVRRRLTAARRTTTIAEERLGEQLRVLYEQGQPDPIAVILGAKSLQSAIDGLEAFRQVTRATRSVIAQARSARGTLVRARAALAVQLDRTDSTRARLAETATGLEQARDERTGYLAALRQEEELTAAQITRLEQQAEAARQKARSVNRRAATQAAEQPSTATLPAQAGTPRAAATEPTPPSEPPPAPVDSVSSATAAPPVAAPPPPRPGGTMVVHATGYCLRGATTTGLPVGPGIVATDPAVIPLGTRMVIPGYGEGVAADTGGRIRGQVIDVWITDCAKAASFTRTVTITFR